MHSIAKGVCVLAAALAADDGLIRLDDTVATLLPDHELGEGVAHITLRHLLSMSSGIDLPWSETLMTDWPDLAGSSCDGHHAAACSSTPTRAPTPP